MKEFTNDEKVIARSIDKEYKWIARNKSGSLNIYTRKPFKGKIAWTVNRVNEYDSFAGFKCMFSSVKREDDEPTLIKDIYDPQILDTLEKVNRRHWIDNHNGTISCSGCQTWFHKDDRYPYMDYCPYCGAKMEGNEATVPTYMTFQQD